MFQILLFFSIKLQLFSACIEYRYSIQIKSIPSYDNRQHSKISFQNKPLWFQRMKNQINKKNIYLADICFVFSQHGILKDEFYSIYRKGILHPESKMNLFLSNDVFSYVSLTKWHFDRQLFTCAKFNSRITNRQNIGLIINRTGNIYL